MYMLLHILPFVNRTATKIIDEGKKWRKSIDLNLKFECVMDLLYKKSNGPYRKTYIQLALWKKLAAILRSAKKKPKIWNESIPMIEASKKLFFDFFLLDLRINNVSNTPWKKMINWITLVMENIN